MELKHLRTFLVVYETKNFTKAAEQLHYAQSNITTHIQHLEKELQTKLFDCIGKSISLTASGESLIPYARKMLSLEEDIKYKLLNDGDKGYITIGASESLCTYYLPKILKGFQSMNPNIQVYLKVIDIDAYETLLEENIVDIVYVLDEKVSHSSIIKLISHKEKIGLYAIPIHPLSHKKKLEIEDVSNMPLILTSKDCSYRKLFEKEIKKANVKTKVILETSSLQVIKEMALNGLGICLLPEMVVREAVEKGKLVKLPYPINYPMESQLMYHKDKWVSPNLEKFLKVVQKESE